MKLSERAHRNIEAERGRRVWRKAYLASLLLLLVCIGIAGYVLPSSATFLGKAASSLAVLASVALAAVSYFFKEKWSDKLNTIELEAGMELARTSGKGKAVVAAKKNGKGKGAGGLTAQG